MLDNPEKSTRLLAALKAAAPFDVELAPSLIEYLQAQNVADADRMHHVVWDLSYAGDEGGIICHLSRWKKQAERLSSPSHMCACRARCHLQRPFWIIRSTE